MTGGKVLMDVPSRQWLDVEISCGLGKAATGKWDLTVTVPERGPRRFEGLPCGNAKFDALDWLGFVSLASKETEFYLDDLKLPLRAGKPAEQ